ncbi:S8 family serine peptidase [Metabacillus sp. FJAT-53654]|uniref:S8 family serine peptidase n=1 Tax=Metabacillus rhizosphaerae TaxID=3117747 RepID=A0ABZ2MWQ4_9BACI
MKSVLNIPVFVMCFLAFFIGFHLLVLSVNAETDLSKQELLKSENASKEEKESKLLVSYKKGANLEKSINKALLKNKKTFKNLNIDVITLDNRKDKDKLIEELKRNKAIQNIEENNTRQLFSLPNDPYYKQQGYIEKLELPYTWDIMDAQPTNEVVVAVLDTGLDTKHEDLQGIVAPGGYNFINNSSNIYDLNGHGTAVSGVIAANTNNGKGISGVIGNANVKILPLQIAHSDGVIYQEDVLKAIDYAIEKNVDIMNMSFGGTTSSTIEQEAIKHAVDNGITIVASAGNEGNTKYVYPASYEGVISVGAVDESNSIFTFSNRNDNVDIVADGSVTSTSVNSTYDQWVGTSFSAPIVSGVVSLYKSLDSTLSPNKISGILEYTAVDLGKSGKDSIYGYGLINPKASVTYLLHPIPSKPKVDQIGDNDVKLTGKSINIGFQIVASVNGKTIGSSKINDDGSFSISIPKQKVGTIIKIILNNNGLESEPYSLKVIDNTPPAIPNIGKFTNKTTTITGKAEANSTVKINNGKTVIKSTTASSTGTYYMTISPQNVNTVLSIISTDRAGNNSKSLTIKVTNEGVFEVKQAVSLANNVKVLNGYLPHNKLVGSLENGEAVKVIDLKNGYYRVIGAKTRGWVHHSYLLAIPTKYIYYGTVSASSASLRNGFKDHNKVIATLANNEPLTIIETKEGYHRVIASYTRGWVKATDVKVTLNSLPYPVKSGFIKTSEAALKNGYMPWNYITGHLKKEEAVQLIDLKMGYYRVITKDGKRGWVHYTNIRM